MGAEVAPAESNRERGCWAWIFGRKPNKPQRGPAHHEELTETECSWMGAVEEDVTVPRRVSESLSRTELSKNGKMVENRDGGGDGGGTQHTDEAVRMGKGGGSERDF